MTEVLVLAVSLPYDDSGVDDNDGTKSISHHVQENSSYVHLASKTTTTTAVSITHLSHGHVSKVQNKKSQEFHLSHPRQPHLSDVSEWTNSGHVNDHGCCRAHGRDKDQPG